jgi:hypothetical protein
METWEGLPRIILQKMQAAIVVLKSDVEWGCCQVGPGLELGVRGVSLRRGMGNCSRFCRASRSQFRSITVCSLY